MQEKGRLVSAAFSDFKHHPPASKHHQQIKHHRRCHRRRCHDPLRASRVMPGQLADSIEPTTSSPNVINLQTFLGGAPTTLQPLSRRPCATQTESPLHGRRSAALRDVPFVRRVYKTSGGPVKDLHWSTYLLP